MYNLLSFPNVELPERSTTECFETEPSFNLSTIRLLSLRQLRLQTTFLVRTHIGIGIHENLWEKQQI